MSAAFRRLTGGTGFILSKLVYVRQGASDRHRRDIAGMLRISGPEIDMGYVDEWARRLGVTDSWDRVRRRAAAE